MMNGEKLTQIMIIEQKGTNNEIKNNYSIKEKRRNLSSTVFFIGEQFLATHVMKCSA